MRVSNWLRIDALSTDSSGNGNISMLAVLKSEVDCDVRSLKRSFSIEKQDSSGVC